MFRVGQKVVCIRRHARGTIGHKEIGSYSKPCYGGVYTVATINEWPHGAIVTLAECDNSHLIKKLGCAYEPGFGAEHFRPIVERKTDISVFKAMLTPADSRKHEVAR